MKQIVKIMLLIYFFVVHVNAESSQKEKVLEMTIEELDLSVRSYNCLKRAGNKHS